MALQAFAASQLDGYTGALMVERKPANNIAKKLIDTGVLEVDLAIHYLNIYVGVIDWSPQIQILWKSLLKKCRSESAAKDTIKQVIGCTVLLPATDSSVQIDQAHPENLLLKMPWFQQLGQKDWFAEFCKVVERDETYIKPWRTKIHALGVISPIEFAPLTRQAYNWLYLKYEEAGKTNNSNDELTAKKLRNLVTIYGGAVICNIFTRHENELKKVLNWRSGYFFERAIYEVYKPEQIIKIKKAELDKTSEKLVTRIN